MPDAVKNIIFKTTVENAQAVQLLDAQGNAIKRMEQELSKTAVTATGKLSPALNISRRDMGLFANQMLYTVGATGKLGSQLSNLASGLLVGGVIGGTFAGFAAIINGIITESEDFNKSLEKLGNTSISVAEKVKIFTQELADLKEPDFWYSVKLGFLNAMGGMSAMLVDIGLRTAELKKAFTEGTPMTGTTPYLGGLEGQLESLEQQQKDAPTKERALSFNNAILQKQKEIDDVLGKQVDKIKDMTKELEKQINLWKSVIRPEGVGVGNLMEQQGDYNIWKSGIRPKGARLAPLSDINNEKVQQDMRRFSEMSAGIFTQNMSSAWENIFGEANSMFEQMISAWASMLMEKIGIGIFSMLFGGIDLFGFARGLFGGQATAAKYGMGK